MTIREKLAAILALPVLAIVFIPTTNTENHPVSVTASAASVLDNTDRSSRGDIRISLVSTVTIPTPVVHQIIKPKSKSKHYWHLWHLRHHNLVMARLIQTRIRLQNHAIPRVWYLLGQCESGGDARYGGPGGHVDPGYEMFEGIYNFVNSTWLNNGGGRYAQHAWGATVWQQTLIGRNVLSSEGPGAWPVCAPRVGLERGM